LPSLSAAATAFCHFSLPSNQSELAVCNRSRSGTAKGSRIFAKEARLRDGESGVTSWETKRNPSSARRAKSLTFRLSPKCQIGEKPKSHPGREYWKTAQSGSIPERANRCLTGSPARARRSPQGDTPHCIDPKPFWGPTAPARIQQSYDPRDEKYPNNCPKSLKGQAKRGFFAPCDHIVTLHLAREHVKIGRASRCAQTIVGRLVTDHPPHNEVNSEITSQ